MMYYRIVHMMLLTDAIPINLIFKETTLNTSVKKKKKCQKGAVVIQLVEGNCLAPPKNNTRTKKFHFQYFRSLSWSFISLNILSMIFL